MIEKAFRPLHGEVELLGDKSIAHRAILFASLAKGKSTIRNFPDSGVTRSMIDALRKLGIEIHLDNKSNTVQIYGNGFNKFINENITCECGNSATTMRLLAGAIAGTKSNAIIDGTDALRKRPIRVDALLNQLGYALCTNDGYLPIVIRDSNDRQLDIPIAIDTEFKSAQVKSSLIIASLGRNSQTCITEQMKTRDHTEKMLSNMGAKIEYVQSNKIIVHPLKSDLKTLDGELPGDISSAAFILVAAAIIPNSQVIIRNILLNDTRTGYFKALSDAGCNIEITDIRSTFGEKTGSIKICSPNALKSVIIDDEKQVGNMIDEFPAIAILMACANGKSSVRNAKELRYKESDRIKSIVEGYRALGLECEEFEDGFDIVGSQFFQQKSIIKTNKDHRIAMAFSLLNLISTVDIDDSDIISQSFPNFYQIIKDIT